MGDTLLKAARKAGWSWTQPFWEFVMHLGMEGMNLGGGAYIDSSGELRLIERVGPIRRAVDAGAHLGDWSRKVKELNPGCAIALVEPNPRLAGILRKEFPQPAANVFEVALDERPGKAILHPNTHEGGASIHYGTEGYEVAVTTLPGLMRDAGWDWVDFVKMDLEGGEAPVLRAMQDVMAEGRVRFIQVEHNGAAHEAGHSFHEVFRLLTPTHDVFRVLRDGKLRRLPHWRDAWETPAVTNYLGVQRAEWAH